MSTITQRELRNDNAAVVRRVELGESFTVTRNGRPVADLVPHVPSKAARRFVPVDEIATGLAALPPWDVAAHLDERREVDDLLDDSDRDLWTRS